MTVAKDIVVAVRGIQRMGMYGNMKKVKPQGLLIDNMTYKGVMTNDFT